MYRYLVTSQVMAGEMWALHCLRLSFSTLYLIARQNFVMSKITRRQKCLALLNYEVGTVCLGFLVDLTNFLRLSQNMYYLGQFGHGSVTTNCVSQR